MDQLFTLDGRSKVFSLSEARDLLPLILKITAEAQREVSQLANRMESLKFGSSQAAKQIEEEIQKKIDHWQTKMTRLGTQPKGLWIADFDNGSGYYCWKYPENDIRFFHGYHDGFSGRKEILTEVKYENSNCTIEFPSRRL